MSGRGGLLLALVLVTGAGGCEPLGCGEPAHLAELVSADGEVTRDFAAAPRRWQPVEKQARFSLGDGVRTGAGSSAQLRLTGGGRILVDAQTLVRFARRGGDPTPQLDVDIGSIELDSQEGDLSLETVLGLIRIERGSRVRLHGGQERQGLDVLFGKLTVERDGKRTEVAQGQELLLDIGGITLERKAEPEPGAEREAVAAVDAGVATPAAVAEPEPEVVEQDPAAPRRAELTIAAGESATVHDPRPPTNVRVPFDGCEGGARLEVARGRRFNHARTRGPKAGIVKLQPGSYRYRVRCARADAKAPPAASGRIVIRRDAGRRRLPTRAPAVTVDADGRPYTVRYQNLLPKVTLRWPDPPPASGYRLTRTGPGGKARTRTLKRASHTYRSGRLREGTHAFEFSTADGKQVARGSVRVAFDNAARAAYLSTPARALRVGSAVELAGAVLSGSSVRVNGTAVPIDAQGRFATQLTPDGRHDAVVVRVEHRASGVHYYLRRLR